MQKRDRIMNILCYLGFLWLIPYFKARNRENVRFHVSQGLTLLVIEVIVAVLKKVLIALIPIGLLQGILGFVFTIAEALLIVLMVVGILNVVNEREKPLPVIGYIKLL